MIRITLLITITLLTLGNTQCNEPTRATTPRTSAAQQQPNSGPAAPVPEPTGALLFAAGLLAVRSGLKRMGS